MQTRSRSVSRAPESPGTGDNGHGNGVNGHTVTSTSNGVHGPGNGTYGNGLLSDSIATRPSRPKHMNPNRTSMNEMKKRVAGILEFVTKAQEEASRRAASATSASEADASEAEGKAESQTEGKTRGRFSPSSKASPRGSNASAATSAAKMNGANGGPHALVNGTGNGKMSVSSDGSADFASLSSLDMLRILKARLTGWESEFGRWGKAG